VAALTELVSTTSDGFLMLMSIDCSKYDYRPSFLYGLPLLSSLLLPMDQNFFMVEMRMSAASEAQVVEMSY
jgi:hypothetical protein